MQNTVVPIWSPALKVYILRPDDETFLSKNVWFMCSFVQTKRSVLVLGQSNCGVKEKV